MADQPSTPSPAGIRQVRRGACHTLVIDRRRALNAIDAPMIDALAAAYPALARDPGLYAVVLRSADPPAFSAGGDVRALATAAREDVALARRWLREEYAFDWLSACFSKPTVALIDGMVMGSGVGLTAPATHRVAGPGYRFAMPETAIGFFPDVGVAHVLARLPHRIGLYLGLTGLPIGRADAFALGLLTHCIDPARYADIETALADAMPVDPLLDGLHRDPGSGDLLAHAATIAHCFGAPTVTGVLDRLAQAARDRPDDPFPAATLDTLRARSPTGLAVAFRHVRDAAVLDQRQTLQVDYRVASRLIVGHDFQEGVAAALVDKRAPRWRPATLADVTDDMLDDLFAPLPGAELELPLRQEMQALRV